MDHERDDPDDRIDFAIASQATRGGIPGQMEDEFLRFLNSGLSND